MWLEFLRVRLAFIAAEPILFPRGKPGNVLRGGFGSVLHTIDRDAYASLYEPPRALSGPSGLRDPARRFVFRAAHLDSRRIAPGESFHFDLHLFDARREWLDVVKAAFDRLGQEGIGASRGRAHLTEASQELMRISLDPPAESVPHLSVEFVTPTELKSRGEPNGFAALFARARDRVSLFASPPPEIDYRRLGEEARKITMTRCDFRHVNAMRRSARTGERHPLGGFTGTAQYEGELREFLPWLDAAQYTGVGRHTAWGQGQIRIQRLPHPADDAVSDGPSKREGR